MAQTNYTPIQLYYSTTAAAVPIAGNLASGEFAVNITDGKLFYKDNAGVVQTLASKAGNINVSSLSFGTTGLTPNTSTTGSITVAGTLIPFNGGTGATTLTGYVYGNGTSAMTASTTIPNAGLANSTISGVSLGSNLNALTIGTGLSGSSYNGSSAVTVAIDSTVSTLSGTQTLTNKWIQPRVLASTANSATPTLNTDSYDMMVITGQSAAITSFTTNLTGTPVNGQKLIISITGTGAIAITWGASFESSTVTLPSTTVTTARLDVGFIWNVATSKWRCVASA
jgi:hypothetical protein